MSSMNSDINATSSDVEILVDTESSRPEEEMALCCHVKSTGDIPDEILDHLLTFVLPYEDMRSCRLVSRRWYHSVKRVELKLRRLLERSLEQLAVSWFHYDTPNPTPGSPSTAHRVITKRCAHSAVMHEGRMYVFGGCSSRMTSFNDLWWLELGRLDWQRPPAVGSYPSPKAYASLVAHGDRLVLFGGWSQAAPYPLHQNSKLFDELHVYHTKECRWEEVRGVTSSAPQPSGLPGVGPGPPRWPPQMARHGASVHGHQMVVVGGLHNRDGNRFAPSNQVWVFDLLLEEWRQQQCSEPAPAPRYGHSQIPLDERHMLLLGGSGGPNQLFQDAWLLELAAPAAEWRWRQLTVEGMESAPSQLWCHPACQVGDKVVVLGRCKGDSPSFTSPQQTAQTQRIGLPPPAPPVNDRRNAGALVGGVAGPSGVQGSSAGPSGIQSGSAGPSGIQGAAAGPSGGPRPSCPETGQLARRARPPPPEPAPAPAPAPLGRPSVRPNARGSRDLRLAGLQRMEARLAAAAAERALPRPRPRCRDPLTAGYRLVAPAGRRPLALHVLDTSAARTAGAVRWRHVQRPDAPDERILYSLVAARGELVLFGGIVSPPRQVDAAAETAAAAHETAFNALSFVAVPWELFS